MRLQIDEGQSIAKAGRDRLVLRGTGLRFGPRFGHEAEGELDLVAVGREGSTWYRNPAGSG